MLRVLAAMVIGMALTAGSTAATLDALRWQKRLLLVFAKGGDALSRLQLDAVEGSGAEDRDLLVVAVPGAGPIRIPGFADLDAAALRRAYAVAEDAPFTVLLVGKDGGVKQRSRQPIAARDLFATIDAMPMRIREARGE